MKNRYQLRMLLRYVGRRKWAVLAVLLASLIMCACEIAAPYLVGRAVDRIIGPGQVDFAGVGQIIGLLAGLYLLDCLFVYLINLLSNIVANRIVADIRKDAFAALSKMPLRYYDTTPHGDIISRFINDCEAIADGLLQSVAVLFSGVITIISTAVIMFCLNVIVTLTVIASTSLTFVVAFFVTRNNNKHFQAQQKVLGALNGTAEEMIGYCKTVKSQTAEQEAFARFDRLNAELYVEGQRAQFAGSLTNPTTRFVNNFAYILIGVVGGIFGGLTAGTVSSFIIYANQFAKPFNEITNLATQILSAYAAFGRVLAVISGRPENTQGERPQQLSHTVRLSIEDVCFSYNKKRPLIEHFSLDVAPGSKIAIVGPTGAGKTTLINLLMRFYDVDGGRILLDGVDIKTLNRDVLRREFAMVLQESWLFAGTVWENIAYSRPDATREEIVAAAKAAHAHSFIMQLENGYDTVLTDGDDLSAGQRQLLTIARAMLRPASFIILDEATSSVDTLTEQRINKGFSNILKGKTAFIIAHRLSTILDADLIVVMRDGKIAETGTHAQLLQKNGVYAELYNSQFKVS